MKTFVPNYYKDFKCIAEKCKHNCCIGWEIDIDEETLSYYESIKGRFRKNLVRGIDYKDDYACFRLDGKGRCAFLKENNLCEIILKLGEDSLCQICSDHPRFRNYYSDRTEMGLGLCCEEAGRILLSHNKDFSLILLSDDSSDNESDNEDIEFFTFRDELFEMLNNENIKLNEKVEKLSQYCKLQLPEFSVNKLVDLYLSLERLDDYWTVLLYQLKETDISDVKISEIFDKNFENLIKYFTYRHITSSDNAENIFFILTGFNMIENICKMHIKNYGELAFENIVEYCRLYSSEIEYSDENIDKIVETIYKKEP